MRALVVDDSRFIRQLIKQTLDYGPYGALDVRYASDAEEALLIMRDFAPDVLIVDINLPNMSGLELIKTLKKEGRAAKFGFISSIDPAELKHQAEATGAAFYVSKPFTKERVMTALQTVFPGPDDENEPSN